MRPEKYFLEAFRSRTDSCTPSFWFYSIILVLYNFCQIIASKKSPIFALSLRQFNGNKIYLCIQKIQFQSRTESSTLSFWFYSMILVLYKCCNSLHLKNHQYQLFLYGSSMKIKFIYASKKYNFEAEPRVLLYLSSFTPSFWFYIIVVKPLHLKNHQYQPFLYGRVFRWHCYTNYFKMFQSLQ